MPTTAPSLGGAALSTGRRSTAKRGVVRGFAVLAVATTGSLVLAAPGSSQTVPDFEFDLLQGEVTPTQVAPGQEVTARSIDTCGGQGLLTWAVYPAGVYTWDDLRSDDIPDAPLWGIVGQEADGSWEVVFDPADVVDVAAADERTGFDRVAGLRTGAGAGPQQAGVTLPVYGPISYVFEGSTFEVFALCWDFSDAALAPERVTAGAQVTVSSIDPCPVPLEGLSLYWDLWRVVDEASGELDLVSRATVEPDPDGAWRFTFAAPDEPSPYVLFAECDSPNFGAVVLYDALSFEVVPAPPAAVPILTTPSFTG